MPLDAKEIFFFHIQVFLQDTQDVEPGNFGTRVICSTGLFSDLERAHLHHFSVG